MNVRLTRALAGPGEIDLAVTVDGKIDIHRAHSCHTPTLTFRMFDQRLARQGNSFDNGFVAKAVVVCRRDSIPIPTFRQQIEDIFDQYARAFEGQISAANLGVRNDVLSELDSFSCLHLLLSFFGWKANLTYCSVTGNYACRVSSASHC
jgi:hypothetical protein